MYDFSEHKNLSKFEKNFLSELLDDIEKRENSSWSKPWNFIESQNAFTGHKYSGLNSFNLELIARKRKIEDPRFATFNQARKNGYHIKKGSKGIPIQFFSFINKETRRKWNEKDFQEKTKNMTPEQKQKELNKKIAIAKTFYVFNANDIISNENKLSLSENEPLPTFKKIKNTNEIIDKFEENLIAGMEVGFREIHSEGAYYTPSKDEVTMPLKDQFNSFEERTSVFLHEIGHATGHEKRLNRDLSTTFADTNYSKEEMKVEMNSVFMSNTLGLNLSDKQRENHLLYLDSWGKQIKQQPKDFIYVLQDSLKIKDYMLEKGKFQELFLTNNINQDKEIENELDISIKEFNNFVNVFTDFSNVEYELDTNSDDIKTDIINENFKVPIAYTEEYDINEELNYEIEVVYDLKNEIQITSLNNDYIKLTKEEDISIDEYTDYLKLSDFEHLVSSENIGADISEVTEVLKESSFENNNNSIKEFSNDHNLTINKLANMNDYMLVNLNRNIINENDDLLEQFENNNITLIDPIITEDEYHKLISVQKNTNELVHYNTEDELIEYYPNDKDIETKEIYKSYESLWGNNFKEDTINNFDKFTLRELEELNTFNNVNIIKKLVVKENKINEIVANIKKEEPELFKYKELEKEQSQHKKYNKSIKSVDKDNDGVDDRIDINDNDNSTQTVSDQAEVGNRTSKIPREEKEKENKKHAHISR